LLQVSAASPVIAFWLRPDRVGSVASVAGIRGTGRRHVFLPPSTWAGGRLAV